MTVRSNRMMRLFLAVLVLGAVGLVSCDDGPGEPDPADFYITVKLHPQISLVSVDRLDMVIRSTDYTVVPEDSSGESEDGTIRWETRIGGSGPEFLVSMTRDYVELNALEVSGGAHEIDVPFNGGDDTSEFNVSVAAYWQDDMNQFSQIARGTGALDMLMHRESRLTINVECLSGEDWTCRTGCGGDQNECVNVEACGEGNWECIEGCCVPG